uniref:Enoyl-CoA hydratase 1, peroxisomal n=1 Tax=Ananas comosus var. bracteatus TaxID=296719 RepID=A0A6V7NIK3_ANACO|nr:unnamed protein product [Ananas comosus var. bracteatus]
MDELIVVERRPHGSAVAVVTINRPGTLNSLTRPLMVTLAGAFRRLDADDAMVAVVLAGRGRTFCSGVDLAAAEDVFKGDVKDPTADPVAAMAACRKPIVGTVAGFAVTAGFEIALACDLLVAGRDAKLVDTSPTPTLPRPPLLAELNYPRPSASSPTSTLSRLPAASPTPVPSRPPALRVAALGLLRPHHARRPRRAHWTFYPVMCVARLNLFTQSLVLLLSPRGVCCTMRMSCSACWCSGRGSRCCCHAYRPGPSGWRSCSSASRRREYSTRSSA